ncbi:PLU-1-like protein-domain-containing protein [Radiomyces spectabilis]|uniref:PLU-1-like protein-domain-containing protein n=1 Tax=Radiomyces spectabilis TaxID=64574 RepID=UPI002220FCE8|nr:PLU-1-like protein-domain-containing protein [Radiomyces spectabilis]KAI8381320.1 PLU-1-like protein-domain-containing protein [Radiomyces spectabilis]
MRVTVKTATVTNDEPATTLDLNTVKTTGDAEMRTRPRIFNLTEAPTYYPTEEEFTDPIEYIQRIRAEGEKYGIVKIVPPAHYKPEFSLNTEVFRFRTRIQKLNSMEGETRANVNYLEQLYKFHRLAGHPVNKIPQLDKRPIDLFKLKKEVANRGGYNSVVAGKKWAEIGRSLGYTRKQCTSMSNALKSAYVRVILPYEVWLAKHKQEQEQASGNNSPSVSLTAMRRDDFSDNQSSQNGQVCEICRKGDREEEILLCDGCDRGYHMHCISPPINSIPKSDWFCVKCLTAAGGDYGFEDGEEYSLQAFQKVCDKFKTEWFSKTKPVSSCREISEEDCEDEFWRLVEDPHETCEVEYGADLHSTQHGSGFAPVERNPAGGSSGDPWNLNMIPILPRSLFTYIKTDISGMMVPWLYVGMCFSAFCWHNEDHYTYSINYMHWGETKTWYGVPGSDTAKFEASMKKAVPELFEQQPDLLFQLVTMLSPGRLLKDDVKVYAVDQRPGQFVVTFPKAYHSGFNHGFNFCEAVNFAPSEWVDYGLECAERYKQYRRQPCFSHDELLMTVAMHDQSVETATWLKDALAEMEKREITERNRLRKKCPRIKQIIMEKNTDDAENDQDDELQCIFCHCYTYLSHVACDCTSKVSCLDHIAELCTCEYTKKSLCMRYSDQQLHAFVQDVFNIASVPSAWSQKLKKLMCSDPGPSLKTLRQLLHEGEKASVPASEIDPLRDFMHQVNDWIDEANKYIVRKPRRRDSHELEPSTENYQGTRYRRMLELLDQASRMTFNTYEIKLLQIATQKLTNYKQEAAKILAHPSATVSDYEAVLNEGVRLNADVEEMAELHIAIKRRKWIEQAPKILNATPINYDQLKQLLDDARTYKLPLKDDPVYQSVVEKERLGQEWIQRAEKALKQQTTLYEIRSVLEAEAGVPTVPALVNSLRALLNRAMSTVQDAEHLIQHIRAPSAEKILMAELERVIKALTMIPVDMEDDTSLLQQELHSIEAWRGKVNKVFAAASRTNIKSVSTILTEVLESISSIIDEDQSSEDAYCVCRRPESGLMIECDVCHEWYHGPCVKVSRREAKTQNSYICPICDGSKKTIRYLTRRPRLEQLEQLIEEAQALNFVPPELGSIQKIMDKMTYYQGKTQDFCRSKPHLGVEDLEMIKKHLRKLEGLEIDLPDETEFLRRKVRNLSPVSLATPPAETRQPVTNHASYASQSNTDDRVYCICRRGYDASDPEMQMIECEDCNEWFHVGCVGLTKTPLDTIGHYACPACARKAGDTSPSFIPDRPKSQTLIKLTLKPPAPPMHSRKRKDSDDEEYHDHRSHSRRYKRKSEHETPIAPRHPNPHSHSHSRKRKHNMDVSQPTAA